MKRIPAPSSPLKPSARFAGTVVAAVGAAAVNMGLFELFDQASSEPWPIATPQALQADAHCDAETARQARTRCAQELVARNLTHGASDAHLASR